MPMPWTYRHADREFKSFLADAKDRMGHTMASDNMTYTAVDGVLQTFRRRLTPAQAIAFADVLPSVVRAIFVFGWDISAPPLPFTDRAEMAREAQALRPNHNLTPVNAIEATAFALWRHVDHRDMSRVLANIGPEAQAFWAVADVKPAELAQRMA